MSDYAHFLTSDAAAPLPPGKREALFLLFPGMTNEGRSPPPPPLLIVPRRLFPSYVCMSGGGRPWTTCLSHVTPPFPSAKGRIGAGFDKYFIFLWHFM